MKKFFALLACAALCVCACDKKNDPDNGGKNNGGDANYDAPIVLDGNFEDWAAIEDKVQVVRCAESTSKKDLKQAKVYADKYYVYVYVEFDLSDYDGLSGVSDAHLHFYINGDNDTSTGGYKGAFDQGETPCIDVMTEGDVIAGGAVCEYYDPTVFTWEGPANYMDWSDDYWVEAETTGFVEGKGTAKAWEFKITRELYPVGKLAKEFTMGIDLLVNGWDATGALPNAEADETNTAGEAPLLLVKLNK